MFDQIASTYDRANRILSLGIDQRWRRKMAHFLPGEGKIRLLDCATGTGDQLLALMSERIEEAVGIDLSKDMLEIGRRKLAARAALLEASATSIPFEAATFDAVTISFGIRNVETPLVALQEMRRVLKPGGRCLVLEFSLPACRVMRLLHLAYLRHALPRIGGWVSGNRNAYRYLNQTIETFPCGKEFCDLMVQAGFSAARAHPLTFGIASIYVGEP
jgi:demethylmenaquinone methyltransferase/2-methoxy-6-polyprenyl-1,4-benzoquinol methylase